MPDEPADHYETVTQPCQLSHCHNKPVFVRHPYIGEHEDRRGHLKAITSTEPIYYCSECGARCAVGQTVLVSTPAPRPRGKRTGPSTDIDDYLAHKPKEAPVGNQDEH